MLAKYVFWGSLGLVSTLGALEFGSMGNTSAGMGGAGVALKHSAWGLYYNPALLSSDPKVKMGYSLGVGLKEHNLSPLVNIDVENMQNTAERLISTFSNASGANPGQFTNIVQDALTSVLTTSGQATSGDINQDLQTYLQNAGSDYSALIQAIQTQVQSSTLTTEQKALIQSIAGNIEYDNLNFDTSKSLSNITIIKGSDAGLDKSVDDIATIQNVLKSNHLNVVSQNGAILQLSTKTLNEKLGSFGVAYFASVYSSISIKANEDKLRLIVNGGNGYYELVNNGSSYSMIQSTKDDYEKYSIIHSLQTNNNESHKLIATSFILSEIPIGYARTFYLKRGNLNIGVVGKLMNGISHQNQMNITTNTNFKKELTDFASLDQAISSNNYGIDAGLLYELDLPRFRYLTVGVVGKNLNSPSFESTFHDITIKPQYRFGVGYNSKFINIAFDADLTPNDLIAFSNIKQQSQMIGGGIALDLKILDLRLGAMKDLRQDIGLILTGGLNVFGFLDVSVQSSTNFTQVNSYKVPQYFNLRIGGSFSF